jgi:hypothetical protein
LKSLYPKIKHSTVIIIVSYSYVQFTVKLDCHSLPPPRFVRSSFRVQYVSILLLLFFWFRSEFEIDKKKKIIFIFSSWEKYRE